MIKINFNPTQLEANIRNIAERASKDASAVLRKAAIRIRDLAREYAPVKSGLLEKNIEYATIKDPATRRNVFTVYVDVDAMRYSGRGELGDYAWIMEEELHPYGRQKGKRYFNLGERSKTKAASGKKVGGRFLSRAIKEGSANVLEEAQYAVARVLNGSRSVPMNYERSTGED